MGDPTPPTPRGLRQLPRGTPQRPCGEERHPLAQHPENAERPPSGRPFANLSSTARQARLHRKALFIAKRPRTATHPTPQLTPNYPNPSHTVNFGT